jgi:hypothetical protein
MRLKVLVQPLQLDSVQAAPMLPRLERIETNEVVPLVVKTVIVRGIRCWHSVPKHPMKGHTVVVIAEQRIDWTWQGAQEFLEQNIGGFVLFRPAGPLVLEQIWAGEISPKHRKCRARLERLDCLYDLSQGGGRIEFPGPRPCPPLPSCHDVRVSEMHKTEVRLGSTVVLHRLLLRTGTAKGSLAAEGYMPSDK